MGTQPLLQRMGCRLRPKFGTMSIEDRLHRAKVVPGSDEHILVRTLTETGGNGAAVDVWVLCHGKDGS